jgi:hypothetical protein
MVADDKHGEKAMPVGEDTSLVEPMAETGLPSANDEGMKKKPEIPPAPVEVVGEPSFRMWRELRLGDFLPVASIPPSLIINPKPVKEEIKPLAVVDAPKPRKPRKKKVMEGMTTVTMEEEVTESPNGVVKTEVEKIEKKKKSPSSYNAFVSKHRKEGKSMKDIAVMWKASK